MPLNPHTEEYKGGVSVVIVANNEEERILEKLENCLELDVEKGKLEIVLVSDGSVDKTVYKARSLNDSRIVIINNIVKQGKAACINQAMDSVKNELVLLLDVRQKVEKTAAKELAKYFHDDRVGVVSGELVILDDIESEAEGVGIYWKYEKFIRKMEGRVGNVPGATGSIYMVRKDKYKKIPSNTLIDDVQIPFYYIEQRYKVLFESQAKAYDVISKDYIREKKRKIRTLAGNFQLIFNNPKYLFPYWNPIWFEFFSHKVIRLLVPYFLIMMLISNYLLFDNNIFYKFSFLIQVSLYFYYFLGLFSGSNLIKGSRLYKILEAFINLNVFSVLGFAYFIRNKNATGW